jgi:hypothetical protein
MTNIRIKAGPFDFEAKLEQELAPNTCSKFKGMLPFRSKIIHVRWSGEGCWIPLGDLDLGLTYENHTSFPAPGDIIVYPGGISETEILLAMAAYVSPARSGSSPATIFSRSPRAARNLTALGKMTLWQGAQDIVFELA